MHDVTEMLTRKWLAELEDRLMAEGIHLCVPDARGIYHPNMVGLGTLWARTQLPALPKQFQRTLKRLTKDVAP